MMTQRFKVDVPIDAFVAVTDDPFSLRGHNVKLGENYFRVVRVSRAAVDRVRLRLHPI